MVTVNGAQIHVLDCGSGAPILFLHGNPDSSILWEAVMAPLSKDFRCIAADLPGFGRSTASADTKPSLQSMANFIDALIPALGISGPIYLVGHDFGGIFALAWLTNHPEKVRRIAVTNTAFFSDYRWHFWAHVWRTPLLGELSMLFMNRPMFYLILKFGSRNIKPEHLNATYYLVTPSVKRTVLQLYRAIRPESFLEWESRFIAVAKQVPVLVLWGDDDPFIPQTFADRFGARRVVHFPGAGHWLPAVAPEQVAEELATFFSP